MCPRRDAPAGPLPDDSVVLAAHPDDEVIGAGLLLARSRSCTVVHLTDGAPLDPTLWPPRLREMTRAEYAWFRQSEARQALERGGVSASSIACLEAPDGAAVFDVARAAKRLALMWSVAQPPAVVVHAYEGGHPDHDAAALAAHLATALLTRDGIRAPSLMEMTSYHSDGGRMVTGRFLDGGPDAQVHVLTARDAALKQAMLDAFSTQAEVLAAFPPTMPERFRPAPAYDFLRAPHGGALWFEIQGWMRGEEWRRAAAGAIDALGFAGVRCL